MNKRPAIVIMIFCFWNLYMGAQVTVAYVEGGVFIDNISNSDVFMEGDTLSFNDVIILTEGALVELDYYSRTIVLSSPGSYLIKNILTGNSSGERTKILGSIASRLGKMINSGSGSVPYSDSVGGVRGADVTASSSDFIWADEASLLESATLACGEADWDDAEWYLDEYELSAYEPEQIYYLLRALVLLQRGSVSDAREMLNLSNIAENDNLFSFYMQLQVIASGSL